ncbi:MAG TPA: GNAT family N-acetyltransferase [Candidatus Dormibacteraeota bacterium]|nr:GNAT family N-acetyltransferase [Candidatus Dormibacteraeota bacterium]
MTVRRARPEEWDRVGEVTVAAYLGLPDGPRHREYIEELRDVAARAADTEVLVAVDEAGTILGAVTYVGGPGPWFEDAADDEAVFRALAVAPEAQGLGVGTALVEACIERARRDGRAALALNTRPSMVAAQRIYERLGFVRTPERDWEFEPGEWLLGYRLALSPPGGGRATGAGPHRLGDQAAVVPRPAATVVLVREGRAGVEVLLSHRPSTMAFAPDVHVFPGGAVDAEDAGEWAVARSRLDRAAAAERLGGAVRPGEALAFHVAAIRELFEEAGVLLAGPSAGGAGPPPEALAQARAELVRGEGSFAGICESLDLELRSDLLVPLSHWVTPPVMARRFDARFFAAPLPAGAEPSLLGDELLAHEWMAPLDALAGLADGSLRLWVPTAANLQRLAHARSFAEIADRLVAGTADPPEVAAVGPDLIRVRQGGAGGVDGLETNAYLVGGRDVVVVDPGDPSEEALLAIVEAVRAEDATISGVALTSADPDHAGGAEHLREGLGVLVHAAPAAAAVLPIPVERLADGGPVPAGDTRLVTVAAPGPGPAHVVFLVPSSGTVLCGDLLGLPEGSIPGPVDRAAWVASIERVAALGPRRLLPAHAEPVEGPEAAQGALEAAARSVAGRA